MMMMIPPPKDLVKRVAIDRTYTMTAMNGVVRMMVHEQSRARVARNESPRAPLRAGPRLSFVVSSSLVLAYEGAFRGRHLLTLRASGHDHGVFDERLAIDARADRDRCALETVAAKTSRTRFFRFRMDSSKISTRSRLHDF